MLCWLADMQGQELARGLVAYDSAVADRIRGHND